MFRPKEAAEMTTPMRLQVPTSSASFGVNKKAWQEVDGVVWANFKTFGGTETTVNGVLSVEDTAQITCWYRPDIKSNCRLVRLTDSAVFEIIGVPENIEMRNMTLKFKVKRVKGGA